MWQQQLGRAVGSNWKTLLKGVLVYGAYNKFKTSPAMFRTLVGFAAGLYSGVYAAQNYEVPKVMSPAEGWHKVTALIEDKKTPPPPTK